MQQIRFAHMWFYLTSIKVHEPCCHYYVSGSFGKITIHFVWKCVCIDDSHIALLFQARFARFNFVLLGAILRLYDSAFKSSRHNRE